MELFECGLELAELMIDAPAPSLRLANWPRQIGRGLVMIYRHTLAPLIGPRCRHLPSCSEYADQAVARFGLWAGAWMALARILRCQPWGTSGLDFVPAELPADARWWAPWRYGRWRGTNEIPSNR
jgi:putative membrane protein insertion efficiency factor